MKVLIVVYPKFDPDDEFIDAPQGPGSTPL
jgi:hypothetical protein